MTKKDTSFTDHQRQAAKARWAKRTPAERSAHAKKMVEAREAARREQKRQGASGLSLHKEYPARDGACDCCQP